MQDGLAKRAKGCSRTIAETSANGDRKWKSLALFTDRESLGGRLWRESEYYS
jgi:hypothetical protein